MPAKSIEQAEIIVAAVAAAHGVSVADIRSPRRTAEIVAARHIAIFLVRRDTGLSWACIANLFCRDHSTCVQTYQKIARQIHHPAQSLADRLAAIEQRMNAS